VRVLPKSSNIPALLSEVLNPFLQDRVDSPWQERFYDYPQINKLAFERCQQDIRAVQQGQQSRGLLLHGEPGSGKTHLLQRLRLATQRDPRTWFIYIPPFPSPGRFWRHLLQHFFYDVCQRSKMPEGMTIVPRESLSLEEGPGQGPLTQIEEALTRHLMGRPLSSTGELARLWRDVCIQDSPGPTLFKRLERTFGRLIVELRLDPDVMRVLRHYVTWNHRSIAYAYLLGRDLPESDLGLLGVNQSLDDEDRAKEAVLSFCRLAGTAFTIIVAFDQLEGLQLTLDDLDSLRTFSVHAVSLMAESSNLLILSAVQTYFIDILKKAVHKPSYDRLAQSESVMTLLSRDTAKRLIEFRLGINEELVRTIRENPILGPIWPFSAKEIEELIPVGGFAARDLIRWANHRFEELRLGVKPPAASADIAQHWNERIEKELQEPAIRVEEGVYEDGLLKLFQTKAPGEFRLRRGEEKDLQLILEGRGEKVGVSVSNTENMTSLAKRLKRLQDLLGQNKVTKLMLVRDSRLPISPTARTTQERLKELSKRGTKLIRPAVEAYAALSVLRKMWNEAAESDLLVGDSRVSMGELKKWLAEATPRPLQDLIDAFQEPRAEPPDNLLDRLLEVLAGRWVMPLEEAVILMKLPEKNLVQWITEAPDVAGILGGPPPIFFLNPNALVRY
jgi:hypothetical protein